MGFPERLKLLREQERYSLEQLSKLVGVRGNTIWRWENNKAKPDTDTLIRVAQALHTSAAFLLGETDSSSSDSHALIQSALNLAQNVARDDTELKQPITAGMSDHAITITDNNTNLTYSFPNNEEGRKSLALFLGYSMGLKSQGVSNTITGNNNNGNKLGAVVDA